MREHGLKESHESNLALDVHRGAAGAVERMVRKYQDGLFGYVSALLRDPSDAQEVAQDAFVRAHRSLTTSYDAARCRTLLLRPWLYRIARNLSMNLLRARRARLETPMEREEYIRTADARQGRESGSAERRTMAVVALQEASESLGLPDRELLELRFVEGLSFAEIAGILGATESSARGRVFRAVRRLRRAMTEDGNEV
jgi:RNA polymerase sigma-70 factor, ECF subfamily